MNLYCQFPVVLHDVSSNHPLNVTHHKKAFCREFGGQVFLFDVMIDSMMGCYVTPSREIYNAIMGTNA